MSKYHVAANMLRVDRADDCVWLVDERGAAPQNIHMTPDQATEAGEALMEAGAGTGKSLTLQIGASRAATRNGYFLGEMFIPDLRVNPRYQDYPGSIVIGGDRGDVWAASAYGDERDGLEGVVLVDVEFKTGLDLDELDRDELLGEAEQVVQESYASIQEETFVPSKRNER